jgi:hypothetical protein
MKNAIQEEDIEKVTVGDSSAILAEIFANKPKISKTSQEMSNTERRQNGEQRVIDELRFLSSFIEDKKTQQIASVNNLIVSMRKLQLRSYGLLVCQAKSPHEFLNILNTLALQIVEAQELGTLETAVKSYFAPKI